MENRGEAAGIALANRYRHTFPLAYEEDVAPRDALADLADLEALREQSAPLPDAAKTSTLRLNLRRPAQQKPERVHLKIVKLGEPVPISDLLPMLENFGLRVISERPYELAWPAGGAAWIQDFELEHRDRLSIEIAKVEADFTDAFLAAWRGDVENDGFNRLLLVAGLKAREIVVLRAYCRYLLQTGVPFSQAYMERSLAGNPAIARNLVRLFERRFDPDAVRPVRGAQRDAEKLVAQLRTDLDAVASLDEDRILRAYMNVVEATLRTNFYQVQDGRPNPTSPSSWIRPGSRTCPCRGPSSKCLSTAREWKRSTCGWATSHAAAFRWSDRREDFRTEILGLMKAQNVKNTLIVPVGAKGGFVCKKLPAGTRDEVQAEVIACYQTLIRSLLDLTDNIVAGKIVPPPRVVRRDPDDTYLVCRCGQGNRNLFRHRQRDLPGSTDTGWEMPARQAARRDTTTRRWRSRRAARGSASSVTSAKSAPTSRRRISP